MKIWFQVLSPSAHVDPRWRSYEEACARYVPTVARPDTQIHLASTETRAPKMILSRYIQYLHLGQVIENAVQAERDGFDAFILGGMRDLGYFELREAVDIPIVFISEVSYQIASLMATKFAVIHSDEHPLQVAMATVKRYGLEDRTVPGAHIGYSHTGLIAAFEQQPERIIEEIRVAARTSIARGATMLVPGFAAINVFLAERGVRDVDGVPILDCQAVAIKIAEMQVDFRRLGIPKAGQGQRFGVSKDDIQTARKIYGLP